jgi:hypothetical protein
MKKGNPQGEKRSGMRSRSLLLVTHLHIYKSAGLQAYANDVEAEGIFAESITFTRHAWARNPPVKEGNNKVQR